jgi:excisionase family DNA binding protein
VKIPDKQREDNPESALCDPGFRAALGGFPIARAKCRGNETRVKGRRNDGATIKARREKPRPRKNRREAEQSKGRGIAIMSQELSRVWRIAKELDVSRKRIYQMVQEGKLEAVRLGPRSMRITRASLERFIEERRERNLEELGLDLKIENRRRV